MATSYEPLNGVFSSYISVGTNPASAGAIRLANATSIRSRNAANNGDVELMGMDTSNVISFGISGSSLTGFVFNESGLDADLRIESDTNPNHFVSDAGLFGCGAFCLGGPASNYGYIVVDAPAMATVASNTTGCYRFVVANNAPITMSANVGRIATMVLNEPNIVTAGFTLNNSYTLILTGAPNEGILYGALWVENGDSHFGSAALATGATTGFLHIPTCAGTPTGVPAATQAGTRAIVFDTTNNKLYVYDGGWLGTAALT